MNFEFDADQQEIQALIRQVLDTDEANNHLFDDPDHTSELWTKARGLGWPGLAVADANGGAGFGLVELGILAEEAGARLAPAPLVPTAICATLIDRYGTAEHHERYLGGLLEGTTTAGVAVVTDRDPVIALSRPKVDLLLVADSNGAILVEAAELDEADLIDLTQPYSTLPDGIAGTLLAGQRLSDAEDLNAVVLAVLAAHLTGVARTPMEWSVAHAQTRHQFGRPIGSFQAVSNRCAEMLYHVEGARNCAYYALWALNDAAPDATAATHAAAALAIEAAVEVTSSAIHLHGGMGFTWEANLHHYYKRALVARYLGGDPSWHRQRLVQLHIAARASRHRTA